MTDTSPLPEAEAAPVRIHAEPVRPEWIDHNGHMNLAYYVLAFDNATEAFLESVGIGLTYHREANRSVFAVEIHVNYLREVGAGAPLAFDTLVLGAGRRRLHLFHTMRHGTEGWTVSTCEMMLVHVDMEMRRPAAMPEPVLARLDALAREHATLPRPVQAGRSVPTVTG
jgi:acyl-CoA thioester hydrolase